MEFLVRVWSGEGCEHEVVGVLEKGRGLLVSVDGWETARGIVGGGDAKLDDRRRIDGTAVGFAPDTAHTRLLWLLPNDQLKVQVPPSMLRCSLGVCIVAGTGEVWWW